MPSHPVRLQGDRRPGFGGDGQRLSIRIEAVGTDRAVIKLCLP